MARSKNREQLASGPKRTALLCLMISPSERRLNKLNALTSLNGRDAFHSVPDQLKPKSLGRCGKRPYHLNMKGWRKFADFLGLRRNTALMLVALVFAGTGEKLWIGF